MAGQIIGRGMASGKFLFLSKSVEFSRPKAVLVIDRDRAADLGISMADVGRNLATLLGGNYVNRFSLDGRSYKVIPQTEREFRLTPEILGDLYLRSARGDQVPLSSLVRIERSVEPNKRAQFQQLNALTIEGLMAPGVSRRGNGSDRAAGARGVSARLQQRLHQSDPSVCPAGSALVVTFFMSLLVIYLVLAAQFESWRPTIILVSVPMSIAGALAFLTLGFIRSTSIHRSD